MCGFNSCEIQAQPGAAVPHGSCASPPKNNGPRLFSRTVAVATYAASEAELGSKLELEWVIRVAGGAESEKRVGRQGDVRASIERVQVFDIGAIEQVEHVTAQFGAQALLDVNGAGHAHVKAGITRPGQRVAAQIAGTVGERVPVAVGVRAGKDVEGLAALQRKQRTEFEIVQNADALGHLTDECQRVALGYVLPGARPLQRQAGLRDISQVGYRVNVGNSFGEAVTAVEAEPMSEALFYLKGPTVIDRGAAADSDEEVTQFREQSFAGARGRSITHGRFAGFTGNHRSGCGHGIKNGRMGADLQSMHVKVARGKCHSPAYFMGNLHAALFAIGRAQVRVQVVGEAD